MIKKKMRKYPVFLMAVIILTAVNTYAQKKKSGLDGKVFDVQLKDDAKKDSKPLKDEISFRSGKVKSTMLADKGGFADAKVKVTEDSTHTDENGVTISYTIFEAEAESSDNAKDILYWTGTVSDDDIEGTLVWGKGGDKVKKSYTYSGSLRGKKKKK